MKFLALTAVLLISGCEVGNDFGSAGDERAKEVMGWLYNADPREDFERSIAAGDLRFKGVYGYSLEIPQVTLG